MEKKKENSSAGKLAAIIMGIVDVLLVVLLVLAFMAEPVKGGTGKVNLSGDFAENADTYGQMEEAVAYASAAEVSYGVPAKNKTKASAEKQADDSSEVRGTADDPYAGFVFPDSDTKELTDSKIRKKVTDAATCRRAINEIYARHGYAFSKQENIDYFNTYEWYKNMEKETDMAKVSKAFSSVEKSNVEKLQAFENSKNWN